MRISDWSSDVCSSDLSGITATQTALQTVSSNIVNATTPGYTRKTVEFQPRTINGVGAGVEIARVGRDVDEFLIGQVRTSTSAVGALQVRDQILRQNENRSEEHTSELQSLMRTSYAVSRWKKK